MEVLRDLQPVPHALRDDQPDVAYGGAMHRGRVRLRDRGRGPRGRGRRAPKTESGATISAHVMCCAMRTGTRTLEIAELVDRMRDVEPKVVGYDLAGAESGFSPSLEPDQQQSLPTAEQMTTILAAAPEEVAGGAKTFVDAYVAAGDDVDPRSSPSTAMSWR
jgi:hypothetical protein